LGFSVSELSDAQRQELKLRGGVRVETVAEPATRAGLREGDIVMAVANTEIKNVKEFEAVLARLDKTKPVAILLRRGEWAQYTLIRPLK
jgi:serine protease Do